MFYEEILAKFNNELSRLQLTTPDFPTEIERCHDLCTQILTEMRRTVLRSGFQNSTEEVKFFKEIKVAPMGHLIYYTEVSSYLVNRPKNVIAERLKYLRRQIQRVDEFLSIQTDFLIYMQSGDAHFDEYYFTRKHLKQNSVKHRYPYLKDADFDTDKGFILSKIKGWGMYVSYLQNEKNTLNRRFAHVSDSKTTLKFTGSLIQKAELYYALDAAKVFNNGNAKIVDIVRGLNEIMGGDEQEVYKRLAELKKRKEPAMFLNLLSQALKKRLEDDDAIPQPG